MDTSVVGSELIKVKKYSHEKIRTNNMIIRGDNHIILDFLQREYRERIKCIYIDPPYNNGESYTHYNDAKKHEAWLLDITQILQRLKSFLTKDGSIWISIDDGGMHYLKVAADGVFGRENFISTIVWQQRTTRENRSAFSNNHEYILVYAKAPRLFKEKRNLLPLTSKVLARYKNPDKDRRGPWQSISANVQAGHGTKGQFFSLKTPEGKVYSPPNGRCWVYSKEKMQEEIRRNNIWFGKNGRAVPRIKKFLNGASVGLTPETLWTANEVGTNKMAKKHLLSMFPDDAVFDTPKPEQLIQRILEIATNKGDFVLDCFLGSGSTISTAHKMERQYIGIEIGNHIVDLVVERMKKVIAGESGGISENAYWKGGGDFNFYKIT